MTRVLTEPDTKGRLFCLPVKGETPLEPVHRLQDLYIFTLGTEPERGRHYPYPQGWFYEETHPRFILVILEGDLRRYIQERSTRLGIPVIVLHTNDPIKDQEVGTGFRREGYTLFYGYTPPRRKNFI